MSNKMFPGASGSQLEIGDARPIANDGVSLNQFHGRSKADRWLVSAEIVAASPTNAEYDLDTDATNLDTVVEAKTLVGADGNGITVITLGDSTSGVVVEDDIDTLTVTIHFEDGVSTVLDVETAITAGSDIIAVKTAGTAAAVLTAVGDEVNVELDGGADSSNSYSLFIWGRDATTKKWGLHSDAYGHVVSGALGSSLEGRQHFVVRDVAAYDRIGFTRETSGSDVVNVTLTEILQAGRGN